MNDLRTVLIQDLKNAYRKWKSSAYFDSFLAIDAKRLAFFELKHKIRENDTFFEEFANNLLDECNRQKVFDGIYSKINVRCFPKNYTNSDESSNSPGGKETPNLISNVPFPKKPLQKIQYLIDLPEEAQILGVLWVMKFGRLLDKKFDDQCYGNRIRKSVLDGSSGGPTPYLYYPYFKKYESWRDEALKVVEGLIDLNLNALMVSLDITGYFYNCRVDFQELNASIKKALCESNDADATLDCYFFLNEFVENIFIHYKELFCLADDKEESTKPFIPIGFLPSYVISNWYLDEFDKGVRKNINPQYYGRYVDDILMVFSLNDSSFDKKNEDEILKELVNFFKNVITETDISTYEINSDYLRNVKHKLILKNQKIKVFYFSRQYSQELIQTFKKRIAEHSSAFFYLQETDEEIFKKYSSNIWKIDYSDSYNKLRSVKNLSVNKFELSRWLAFLINFSGKINPSEMEKVIKTLFETLSGAGYLNNFNLWEKYIYFFFKHEKYEEIKLFCKEINDEISSIELDEKGIYKDDKNKVYLKEKNELANIKETLMEVLYAILQKIFSLRKISAVEKLLSEIDVKKKFVNEKFREAYLTSFMFNTLMVPFPLIDYKDEQEYDLINFHPNLHEVSETKYLYYYPRYVHLHEIQLLKLSYPYPFILSKKKEDDYKIIWKWFWKINYGFDEPKHPIPVSFSTLNEDETVTAGKLQVGEKSVGKKIRVGIANVNVSPENFENNLKGVSSFESETRKTAAKIINAAIKENVDFLVLPECFVHYSWIGKLIRVARDHQMGMVFGLEHVIDVENKIAYNYLVTLLPFKLGNFNNCIVEMRLKNYPSPSEEKEIIGHLLNLPPKRNRNYVMYSWKGVCFAPYSCFEIACIEDRALFKSKIDALVIVEWNKDIEYFSSIVESLSRDIHCYCIQVNSSEYGDNRITQPTHSSTKDIVRAKGGENDYLIVGTIDIEALRNAQTKNYQLQKEQEEKTGKFKPTPPGFDPEEVKKR